jgi:hypothetical protein
MKYLSEETRRVLAVFDVPSSAWDAIGMTGFPSKEVARAIHICLTCGLIRKDGYDEYGEQLFRAVVGLQDVGAPPEAKWDRDSEGAFFWDPQSGEKVRLRAREEG